MELVRINSWPALGDDGSIFACRVAVLGSLGCWENLGRSLARLGGVLGGLGRKGRKKRSGRPVEDDLLHPFLGGSGGL